MTLFDKFIRVACVGGCGYMRYDLLHDAMVCEECGWKYPAVEFIKDSLR